MVTTMPANELGDIVGGRRRWIYTTTTGAVLLTDGRRFYDGHVRHVFGGIGSLDPFLRDRRWQDGGGAPGPRRVA